MSTIQINQILSSAFPDTSFTVIENESKGTKFFDVFWTDGPMIRDVDTAMIKARIPHVFTYRSYDETLKDACEALAAHYNIALSFRLYDNLYRALEGGVLK